MPTAFGSAAEYLIMAQRGIGPSEWDGLSEYDREAMRELIWAEAECRP